MNYENFRKFINELTDIVSRERIVILSFIMAAILIKSFFYYLDFRSQSQAVNIEVAAFPDEDQSGFTSYHDSQNANFSNSELFPFDPMTVSYEDLVRLGFSEKTAHIFINYRTKGGRFFQKEDVKKIYGVSPQLYKRIEPYISIGNSDFHSTYSRFEKKSPSPIDINTASIEEWKSLPGIGDFFAKKNGHDTRGTRSVCHYISDSRDLWFGGFYISEDQTISDNIQKTYQKNQYQRSRTGASSRSSLYSQMAGR